MQPFQHKPQALFWVLFLLIICLGLWLRLRNIEDRPMHGDEANQAHQFGLLLNSKGYTYEPVDFHGPTLYYLTLPFFWFSGTEDFKNSTKTHFRIVPVFFSVAMLMACLLFFDILGKIGVLTMSLFIMISPSMVYYSTYYIQETLLLCFTLFFVGSIWKMIQKPSWLWAISTGASLGLMHSTKETFILTLFSLSLAIVFYIYKSEAKWNLNPKLTFGAGLSAISISILFYSSFFTNTKGPIDSITAFQHHFQRGFDTDEFDERFTSGEAHSKAFAYYIGNIVGHFPQKISSTIRSIWRNSPARPISEIIFFLLPLLTLFNLKKLSSKSKIFFYSCAIFSISLLFIYSLIPYKTPWCMLSFLLGFIMLSAFSLNIAIKNGRLSSNKIAVFLSLLLILDLGRQSSLINAEDFSVTDKNPYAYVQPYFDVEDLAKNIENFSIKEGQHYDMPIHFLTPEYWPMPWYLKKFNKVGYWEEKVPPIELNKLPLIITTPDREDIIQELEKSHFSEMRGRLPGYYLLVFYRNDVWSQSNELN